MREIKFRCFYKGKMVYFNAYKRWGFINHAFDESHACLGGDEVLLTTNPEITQWMQFTGLLDKNGVEIYEGDILNVCNGSLNGVEWMHKPYAVEYVLNKGFNICMFCWDKNGESRMDSTHWCEVIGNVFEHLELLESK